MTRGRWLALALGALVVVAVVVAVVVVVTATDDDGDQVVLSVAGDDLTRDELDALLEDISGNVLYLNERQRRGIELDPYLDDGTTWDPAFEAEVLNDDLYFRLAAVALAERGGAVSAIDREAGSARLGQLLESPARLEDRPGADVEVALELFGESRTWFEDGFATLEALRRVVSAEADPDDPPDGPDELLNAALADVAARTEVVVDPAVGRWDPDQLRIVVVDASVGELTPIGPDDAGGDEPAPVEYKTSNDRDRRQRKQ